MRRATLWNIWVCSYFWGARTFWGVRFRALYKAKSLPEGLTPIAPAALGLASAKQPPSSTRSELGRGSGGSPLSIKPIIMASDKAVVKGPPGTRDG